MNAISVYRIENRICRMPVPTISGALVGEKIRADVGKDTGARCRETGVLQRDARESMLAGRVLAIARGRQT